MFLQGTTNPSTNGGLVAFPSDNGKGNILICQEIYAGVTPAPATPSDSQGNAWNTLPNTIVTTGNTIRLSYALNCKSGPNTVTVGVGSSYNYSQIGEYSANALASVDNQGVALGQAGTSVSLNINTSPGNILIVGSLACFNGNIASSSNIVGLTSDWAFNVNTFPSFLVLASARTTGGLFTGGFTGSGTTDVSIAMVSFLIPIAALGSPSRPSYGTGRSVDFRVNR